MVPATAGAGPSAAAEPPHGIPTHRPACGVEPGRYRGAAILAWVC
jgi:hypothetical protein